MELKQIKWIKLIKYSGSNDLIFKQPIEINYKQIMIDDIIIEKEISGLNLIKLNFANCFSVKKRYNLNFIEIIDDSFEIFNCSYCYTSFIPICQSYLDKLKYLYCSHNYITTLNQLKLCNLIEINCSHNLLQFIPNEMNQLEHFNLSYNKIYENIDFLNYQKLKYLIVSSNQINTISNLPNGMIYLDLSSNRIKSLNLPNSIEYLNISNNQFETETDIDFVNCSKLKYLIASSNRIKKISKLPNGIICLDLSNNHINNFDILPDSIEFLSIAKTNLTQINFLKYSNLKYLNISINKIFNIDGVFSNGLEYLNCSQCEITQLDNLPCTLKKLICENNNIKSLDTLPNSIEYLNCCYNNIRFLNNLPSGLLYLSCSNNELINLNNLPKKLNYLNCSNNFNLKYLNNLPKSIEKINCTNYDNKYKVHYRETKKMKINL